MRYAAYGLPAGARSVPADPSSHKTREGPDPRSAYADSSCRGRTLQAEGLVQGPHGQFHSGAGDRMWASWGGHWLSSVDAAGAGAESAAGKPSPLDQIDASNFSDLEVAWIWRGDNYGAGPMIIWDRGDWVALEDPVAGLESGKLLFELRGYKLRGRWTLVKIKDRDSDADNTWLLIKERDGLEGPGREVPEASILSGLTVEQLGEGHDPAEAVLERLDELEAPARKVRASSVKPMLAETREKPFTRKGWVFELKYDGYRIIAAVAKGKATLYSRNGNDLTASFPEIASSLEALPFGDFIVDGEVVVHDDRGIPSFQRLQQRAQLRRAPDIARASVETPATLYLFDCLGFDGHDLRPLALVDRKDVLRMLLPPVGPLRYSDHIPEQGEAMYAQVVEMGLEGIVAKKADSPYVTGRSKDWLKIRADLHDDFVVVGWTEPKGARSGLGAFHLGVYEDGELVYAGRAGSGLSEQQLAAARERTAALGIETAFDHTPFRECVLFDPDGREYECRSAEPLWYLVRRGTDTVRCALAK